MDGKKGGRNWHSFPKNLLRSLARIEMAPGLLSIILALTFQPIVQIPAIIVLGGYFIYLIYLSFPERMLNTVALADTQQSISLDQLTELDASAVSIGVVGAKQTGKSTFLHHALQISSEPLKTSNIIVRIFRVPGDVPNTFCALVDGDGSQLSQQFDICNHSELLFIFLDHDVSGSSKEVSSTRLSDHISFLDQLRSHLKREGAKKPRRIHFVLNKQDLWQSSTGNDADLIHWFRDITTEWEKYGMADAVSASQHSNLRSKDVQSLRQLIKEMRSP